MMEQQFDATYLRPSLVSKALALSLVALGLGGAVLLTSLGLSFLWKPFPDAIDLRIKNPELTVRPIPPIVMSGDGINEGKRDDNTIQQEVIVFLTVKHDEGAVVTGWKFPNGSARVPSGQFCYFTASNADSSSIRIDLATDGKPLTGSPTEKVPAHDEALSKCKWWRA
jgi:hypothetical protein